MEENNFILLALIIVASPIFTHLVFDTAFQILSRDQE